MKILGKQAVRAIASIVVGVLATVIIGGMLGFPKNPAAFKARQEQLTKLVEANPVTTPAETEAIFNTPLEGEFPADPPDAIAIIQWHPLFLGIFSFIAFLIARVRLIELALVAFAAAALLAVTAGLVPAISLLVAATSYFLLTILFPGMRKVAA